MTEDDDEAWAYWIGIIVLFFLSLAILFAANGGYEPEKQPIPQTTDGFKH
jgi:hypothetical protein